MSLLIGKLKNEYFNCYKNNKLSFNELKKISKFFSDQRFAKIHNFEILEKNFKNLDIPFDTIKAMKIIEEKKGVATKTIYQTKIAIERKGQIPDTIRVKKCIFNNCFNFFNKKNLIN